MFRPNTILCAFKFVAEFARDGARPATSIEYIEEREAYMRKVCVLLHWKDNND
jgi:hypothetical protein